jgi:hypothetical protein
LAPASQHRQARFEEVDHFLWMLMGAFAFGARIDDALAAANARPVGPADPRDEATAEVLLGLLAVRARLRGLVGARPTAEEVTAPGASPPRPSMRELRR